MKPTIVRTALEAAARGQHVFPLVPGEKRPAFKSWEAHAITDPKRITRFPWGDGYGLGIACGPSHLVVIDLDQPKPGFTWADEWAMAGVVDGADVFTIVCERAGQTVPWDTYTSRTPSGGTHLYFTAPAGVELRNTSGDKGRGLGPLVDTRAHGGYVVGAGTVISTGSYAVVHDVQPAPLPGWLAAALTPPPPPPPPPPVVLAPGTGDRAERYVASAITAQVNTIYDAHRAGDGRKNALYLSAIALGQLVAGGALTETRAGAELERAAVAVGLPIASSRRSIASGFRAGARRPREVAIG